MLGYTYTVCRATISRSIPPLGIVTPVPSKSSPADAKFANEYDTSTLRVLLYVWEVSEFQYC
jgi:hypothetical protein